MTTPFLGVLKVNSIFPRPPGDVASLGSWNIPVKVKTVTKSSVYEVVETSNDYDPAFVQAWIDSARELIEEGAVAIVTSCGFLAALHPVLQAEFPLTPIGTSSLLQIPSAQQLIAPGKRIGVITFNGDVLGERHLKAVGADPTTPIVGVTGSFQTMIKTDDPNYNYDLETFNKEHVEAAKKLMTENDNIGGIVLECANMGPFRHAIRKATGLPVWDIVTLGNFVYDVGLSRSFQ